MRNDVSQAPFQTSQEAVSWITGLISFGIRPGLERMKELAKRLGHPERRLKFIHVAGTNGKGSTCAFLSSVLRRCGYAVGTFTSPYLTRYADRIQLNGEPIPDGELLSIANKVRLIADDIARTELGSPTMFEVTTAIALEYFAKSAYPDFVVWETGLGGKSDCTNIVTPIVSVITNIGHDHTDILGGTLEQIAGEKAGIIKPGVPVVCAETNPDIAALLERAAREKKSTFYLIGREYKGEILENSRDKLVFRFEGPFLAMEPIRLSLIGAHQAKNAAAAMMTLEVLRQYYAAILEEDDVKAGFAEAAWPGRMETLEIGGRTLLLDGAHNPEGAESLARALQDLFGWQKLHFMAGMLSNKNHSGYLWHILPIVDTLIVSEPDFRKKMDADALARVAEQLKRERGKPDLRILVEPDWKQALQRLLDMTGERDLAVVSGTLYLISDVRSWLLNGKTGEKGW